MKYLPIIILRTLLLLTSVAGWNINVIYGNGAPSALIQTSINSAMLNLQTFIALTTNINIDIEWHPLGSGIIAESSPSDFCSHPDSANYPFVLIPSALYAQLVGHGSCPYSPSNVHGIIYVNTIQMISFNYGTSGTISNSQVDFVTVIMHEMMHILGMASAMNEDGSYFYAPYGVIFDWYIFYGTHIGGWPASFAGHVLNPAINDTSVLTGGNLYFNGTFPNSYFALYAPSIFNDGSSISHTAGPGLMHYSLSGGMYWHTLSSNLFGMMQTFGYDMTNCSISQLNACGNCLPNYPCFSPSHSSSSSIYSFFF